MMALESSLSPVPALTVVADNTGPKPKTKRPRKVVVVDTPKSFVEKMGARRKAEADQTIKQFRAAIARAKAAAEEMHTFTSLDDSLIKPGIKAYIDQYVDATLTMEKSMDSLLERKGI